jgi:hypothetical protein
MNLKMLNPRLWVFLIFAISTLIWVFYKPYFSFEKYVSFTGIVNYCAFFILILAASFITEKTRIAPTYNLTIKHFCNKQSCKGKIIYREVIILATIAMVAQLLWVGRMIMQEGLSSLIHLLVIDHNFAAFKDDVVNRTTLSGVTTLTQLGMIASGMYAFYVFGLKNKGSFRLWLFILFPGILRGMFFSERLALIEVVIPILIMAIFFGKIRLTVAKIALGAVSFLIFFSLAEALRSYAYYAKNGLANYGMYSYGIDRFIDYISSSVNHSMAMVDLSGRMTGFPTLMFSSILTFWTKNNPTSAVSTFLGSDKTTLAYYSVKNSIYSAPDYTNMGFFGQVFADSGYLYIFYALVYGVIIGTAYKGLKNAQFGWIVLYPVIFISILESYRIPYLFDVRVVYPLLYIVLRYFITSYHQHKLIKGHSGHASAKWEVFKA